MQCFSAAWLTRAGPQEPPIWGCLSCKVLSVPLPAPSFPPLFSEQVARSRPQGPLRGFVPSVMCGVGLASDVSRALWVTLLSGGVACDVLVPRDLGPGGLGLGSRTVLSLKPEWAGDAPRAAWEESAFSSALSNKASRLLEVSRESQIETRYWEVSPRARGLPSRGHAGGRFEVGAWEAKFPCSYPPPPTPALSRVLRGLTLEGPAYPAVVLGPRGRAASSSWRVAQTWGASPRLQPPCIPDVWFPGLSFSSGSHCPAAWPVWGRSCTAAGRVTL